MTSDAEDAQGLERSELGRDPVLCIQKNTIGEKEAEETESPCSSKSFMSRFPGTEEEQR